MATSKVLTDQEITGTLKVGSLPNNTGSILTVSGLDNKTISIRTPAQIIADLGLLTTAGNAASANKLQTARTIWGVNFDGSANISGAMTGVTTLTATGTITAPTFAGNLTGNAATVTNGVYTNNFIRASTNFATTSEISSSLLDMSPLNNPFTWHDWLAFNRASAGLAWETSEDNGTSWSTGTVPMNLFIQKALTVFSLNNVTTAARLTINSPSLQYSSIKWIQIMGGYSTRRYRLLAESSADGTTWTEVHTTGIDVNLSNSPNYFWAPPVSTHSYFRITIYSADLNQLATDTLNIGAIRLLTNRIGSQGLHKEYELPYDWDSTRKMIIQGASFAGAVTMANSLTVTGALTASTGFTTPNGDGIGLKLWNSDSYKIWMSTTGNATWGGQVTGATASDYNMYFKMSSSNRGFVFITGDGTPRVQFNNNGAYINGVVTASGGNSTNWNTAYAYSQVGHLPLTGGSITGRLGLNGVTPTSTIHIKNAGGASSGMLTELTDATKYATTDWKNTQGEFVQMLVTGSSFSSGLFQPSSAYFNSEAAGGGGVTATHATGLLIFATGGNQVANIRQIILANGNIGMGTLTPTEKLDVVGNGKFSGTLTASGGNSTNWNTAFSWGNHAGLYAPASHSHSFASLTGKPTTLAGYGITDGGGSGSVTSVAMTVPTGLTVTGSPITTSGTFALALSSGYSIPTTASQTNWNTAFTNNHTHSNKAFLDTVVANATLGLNITGSATKWNGLEFLGTEAPINAYMMAWGADSKWHYASTIHVRDWLGLGSNAFNSTAYLPLTGNATITGPVYFGGGARIETYGSEAIRMINSGAYISAYANGGSVRNGYLQFNDGNLILESETGTKLIRLNPGSGGNVVVGYNVDQGFKLAVSGDGYFNGTVRSTNGFKSYTAKGMAGDYDQNDIADKVIWTIGEAWNNVASMYGIGYAYSTKYNTSHQIVNRVAGVITSSIDLQNGNAWFDGKVTAGTGTNGGFQNQHYNQGHNNIWRLAGDPEYGMGYYQAWAGSGVDAIGFHFGNRLAPKFFVDIDGNGFFNGRIISGLSQGQNGSSWSTAQMEVQGIYPGIGFHWPGTYGASLYMESVGRLVWGGNGFFVTNNLTASGDVLSGYSDRRLKTNMTKISSPLDKVDALQGMIYQSNALAVSLGAAENTTRSHVGLIAQELQAVLPEAVHLAPFDREGSQSKSGENYLTIQYEKVVPLLVEAIKELRAEVRRLSHGIS